MRLSRVFLATGGFAALALLPVRPLAAQDTTSTRGDSTAHADSTARRDSVARLRTVRIVAPRVVPPRVPAIQALTLPVTASVTAAKATETVNLVDTEDAVKYQPTVFLRKRNAGDTQATLATRTWGTGSSARSLIFADGVPLTALVANNNTIGGPRWGLVSPAEIERIDMMFGPFSAAYAGNSIGAVMEITTRLPEKLEGSVTQTQGLQRFDLYGTRDSYSTAQTTASVGDRVGRFAFWASGNYQNSFSQPLSYATSATFPANTTGAYAEQNKLGASAKVLGATGLLHTKMTNAKIKVAFDVTPTLRASYTFGLWRNDADASVDPYLRASDGSATYAGQSGFASGFYDLDERHTSHALTLRTDRRKDWDAEATATSYDFGRDKQRTPISAATGATFGDAGRVAVLDGTGWRTLDLKGTWHRGGMTAAHTVSVGAHADGYTLLNTTFNTPNWRNGTTYTGVFTEGDGSTHTQALWAQDAWRIAPSLTLTAGLRAERWHAFDGYNVSGTTQVRQPEVRATRYSPKASLAWSATPRWTATASVGKAYRFATPAELYQLVSTGTTFTSPDPNLKPDNVTATELRVAHRFDAGSVQLALFQDDVHDAIISQFLPLVAGSSTLYSFVSNVDHVRSRGAELALSKNDVLFRGLELAGSATYVNARTLATSGAAGASATSGSPIGKQLPNIPNWRANFLATYRPDVRLALSLGGRYSARVYTTLDNADVHPNTYQGFAPWFVADARANYRVDAHWSAAVGVDNLLDQKYFLFHPFPQRTLVASLTYGL